MSINKLGLTDSIRICGYGNNNTIIQVKLLKEHRII